MHINAKTKFGHISDVKELAARYSRLTDEEYSRYQELGKQATVAHALGTRTFPVRSRRARYQRGRGDEVLWNEHAAIPRQNNDLSAWCARVRAGEPVAFPAVPQDPIHRMTFAKKWKIALRGLAEHLRMSSGSEATQQRRTADATCVQNYDGVHREETLQSRIRLLDIPCADWKAMPHCVDAVACSLAAQKVLKSDENPSALQFESQQTTSSLSTAWLNRHSGVESRSCTLKDPRKKHHPCMDHRMCHCVNNPQGRHLRLLYSRFAGFIKRACADQSLREDFVNGFLMVEWQLTTQALGDLPAAAQEHATMFTLIPLAYLSPWRPTFAEVFPLDAAALPPMLADGALPDNPPFCKFEVREDEGPPVKTLWQILVQLDLQKSIDVCLWTMSKRAAPMADISGRFAAVRLSISVCKIWFGSDKEKMQKVCVWGRNRRGTQTSSH